MYNNGQLLTKDIHFIDHIDHGVPIQIYFNKMHDDIGFAEKILPGFVKVNNIFYSRNLYTFISRPGY